MATTVNCGGLHIRTPQTDASLTPNTISQSISATGMRIGIVPETSDTTTSYSYSVIIKNSSGIILYQNSTPISQPFYGDYIYVTIPLSSIPPVSEVVSIKIVSNNGCTSTSSYTITQYTAPTGTTVNVNGAIDKYIRVSPTLSDRGFNAGHLYYYKCDSNSDSDDACLVQFYNNTDATKVLRALPSGSNVVDCPVSDEWSFLDMFCLEKSATTVSGTTTSTTTTTKTPCSNGLTLDNITYVSGNTYKVQFTAMDVQSISWKLSNSGGNVIKTGNTGTLTSAIFSVDFGTLANGSYTLNIQADNCSSSSTAGTKTFIKGTPTSALTITEPNKSQYYFSDGHAPNYYDDGTKTPNIFTNASGYDAGEDIVWMKNDKIKIGINLKRGGQLMWVSELNSTENLVYNGDNGTYQIQFQGNQKPDGYTQNSQVSNEKSDGTGEVRGYNTKQGGDFLNHSQSLIDYKRVGDSYCVKVRPIFQTLSSELSEVTIEIKYTLIDRAVKIETTYHSFRTDNQMGSTVGFDGYAMPSCFIINTLDKYQVYTGNNIWSNDTVEDGSISSTNVGKNATEKWGLVYRTSDNKSIGAYSISPSSTVRTNFRSVVTSSGTEFTGGYTYFDIGHEFDNIIGNRGNYTKTNTSYIATGTPTQVREQFKTLSGATSIPSPTGVQVLALFGESNSIGKVLNSDASTTEVGVRTKVKIWNPDSNQFETLNIGVNNMIGTRVFQPNTEIIDNGYHGWELGISNLVDSGYCSTNELYIVKVGFAGAFVRQFRSDANPRPNYWDAVADRIDKVKNALTTIGKTPTFHVLYSQGINDKIAGWSDFDAEAWKVETQTLQTRLRTLLGGNPRIVMTKFSNSIQDFTEYNNKIQAIADAGTNIYALNTQSYARQVDDLHWTYTSQKAIAKLMIDALGLVAPVTTVASTLPTITQPNRIANYYKSESGNADIIHDYRLNHEDNVYLENNVMKVGISLRGGGAITYFSKAGSTVNFINNDDDGGIGRQIQPDYYQKPVNFSVEGKALSQNFPTNGYNTTLGGDDFKNVPTLLDYYPTTDGYYLKFKPLIWGTDGHVSEITMEVLYKLVGNTLKATYTYTSERTDASPYVPSSDPNVIDNDGWSLPTLHVNKMFKEIYSYGLKDDEDARYVAPYAISDNLPSNAPNTTSRVFSNIKPKDGWVAIKAPSENITLGIINKQIGYVRSERKNIINEIPADDTEDAVTIVEFLATLKTINTNLRRVRTDDVYFVIGSVDDVKAKASTVS